MNREGSFGGRERFELLGWRDFFFGGSGRLSGANGKVKEGIGCWTSGSINGFYWGESRVFA